MYSWRVWVLAHAELGSAVFHCLRSLRFRSSFLDLTARPLLQPVLFDVLKCLAVYACCSAIRFATFIGKCHHVFSVHLVVQSIEAKVGRSLRFVVQRRLQLLRLSMAGHRPFHVAHKTYLPSRKCL